MKNILICILLFCGCGDQMGDRIATLCIDVTNYPPVVAGITAAKALGTKAYECEDSMFDGPGPFQQWNGMATINHHGILMRRFSDQYLCQCAFHEGIHASSKNWYGEVPSDIMVETCKNFSLTLPENPSWMGI